MNLNPEFWDRFSAGTAPRWSCFGSHATRRRDAVTLISGHLMACPAALWENAHGQRLGAPTEAAPEVPSGVAASHVGRLDPAKVTGTGHVGGGILSPRRQLQTPHMASVSQFMPLNTILRFGHRKTPPPPLKKGR